MCIDHDSPLCIFVALIRTPNLRKAEEEPLLRREAVDFFLRGLRILRERFLQRDASNLSSTRPAHYAKTLT